MHIVLQCHANASGGETRFPQGGGVYTGIDRNRVAAFDSSEGDHRLHTRRRRFFNNFTTVIFPVSQQILSFYPINLGTSLRTISDGTSCDKESDRHTMRIHGQMYPGVEPPFVRAISWFPPGAPLA